MTVVRDRPQTSLTGPDHPPGADAQPQRRPPGRRRPVAQPAEDGGRCAGVVDPGGGANRTAGPSQPTRYCAGSADGPSGLLKPSSRTGGSAPREARTSMVRGWTVNALDLLDDQGLDALSTRAVADRLGVRMNTVLRHVKTKARLLELTADAADRPALLRTLGHLTGGDPAPITPRHYWFT
ncbi:hypothetical protein KPATCC21470_0792 [Kitasatospora purpeofusca]